MKKCFHLLIRLEDHHAPLEDKSLRHGQKRRYEKHFVSKLSDADGEQLETQHWIETMFQMKYQKAYYGNMIPLEKC